MRTLPGGARGRRRPNPRGGRQVYLPLDWRRAVQSTLDRIQPSLLVIVETELWPNLLRAAHDSGTRIILINARLSTRSFGRYRLLRPFMRACSKMWI